MKARYLTYRDTMEYTSFHFTTMKKLVREGLMPKPVRITPKIIRFDKVKLCMAMAGVSVERIESLSEKSLMEAFDTENYRPDQNDPDEGDGDDTE